MASAPIYTEKPFRSKFSLPFLAVFEISHFVLCQPLPTFSSSSSNVCTGLTISHVSERLIR